MQFDEDNSTQQEDGYVEIYSKNAVLWFSILTDPLIGGILLIINLWAVGYKKAIVPVVAFLLVIEVLITKGEYWFVETHKLNPAKPDTDTLLFLLAVTALRVIGGLVLVQYFYKKYFPEDDYYPKSIVQPLLITVFVVVAMQYFGISF